MKRIAVFLVALQLAAPVHAGLFSRSCYYRPRTYYRAPVVKQVVVREQPQNVFVVQNNNAQPLVGAGATAYQPASYSSSVLPLFDPTSYLQSSLELQSAVNATNAAAGQRAAQLVETIVRAQAPAVERLAAGQAADMVLKAAGLDPAYNRSGGASGVVISRDAQGKVSVTQIDPQKAAAYAQQTDTAIQDGAAGGPVTDLGARPGGNLPTVTKYCGSCHGEDLTDPKGGLYLGSSQRVAEVMRDSWFAITDAVTDKTMPQSQAPQPSDQERAAIIDELRSAIQSR